MSELTYKQDVKQAIDKVDLVRQKGLISIDPTIEQYYYQKWIDDLLKGLQYLVENYPKANWEFIQAKDLTIKAEMPLELAAHKANSRGNSTILRSIAIILTDIYYKNSVSKTAIRFLNQLLELENEKIESTEYWAIVKEMKARKDSNQIELSEELLSLHTKGQPLYDIEWISKMKEVIDYLAGEERDWVKMSKFEFEMRLVASYLDNRVPLVAYNQHKSGEALETAMWMRNVAYILCNLIEDDKVGSKGINLTIN